MTVCVCIVLQRVAEVNNDRESRAKILIGQPVEFIPASPSKRQRNTVDGPAKN